MIERWGAEAIVTAYRLLIFSDNRLVRAENVEADGPVEAVQACSERHRFERIELWAEEGRVAVLGSASSHSAFR